MNQKQVVLTGDSTIATWLDHPDGGGLLRGMLADAGSDASSLTPALGLPLQQLVVLSQGAVTQDVVDSLVRAANNGEIPDVHTEPATSAVPRFAGQTVVVTGAASGIGRAVVTRVAREGGRIIAVDIFADRLDDLTASLPDAAIIAVTGDVTNQVDIDAMAAATDGRVDSLANVAGINDDFSPAHETTDQMWDRVIGINMTGPFKLMRAVLPAMLAAKKGSIVNVTSEAALRGNASGNAYTVSKHGVVGLTRSAAFMYGSSGIRVNAVAPGGVATGIPMPQAVSEFGLQRLQPFHQMIPSVATAEQVASSICFLLSDDAANINGVVLPTDGGWAVQ
jgi:NAD(P)-dependent dehydrogenase (short-subunit alcohol dehydrogenase family)